jgi:RNA polymerase sigma-70 factor (ECF subfamily)
MLAGLSANALEWGAFATFVSGDRELSGDPVEAKAIERARSGDGDAFDVLLSLWSRRVISLAWTLTGSADAAEEIAQETFVRAWETLPRFRSDWPFGPWLLRIATNLSIDHLRRAKKYERFDSLPDPPSPANQSPESRAVLSDAAKRVARAIASLPEMQRVVAQLYLVEEYDHAEIAAMTGLREGTIRSHLSIARSKLRDALGGGGAT